MLCTRGGWRSVERGGDRIEVKGGRNRKGRRKRTARRKEEGTRERQRRRWRKDDARKRDGAMRVKEERSERFESKRGR